ncbi:MAG: histidine kinase dimerization/phospho-acceptor domain-containing protein [Alphaproteobacteria bacterium]
MTDKQALTRAELEKKVEEADALAQMKSNFLATMSHEIRTPMQTIYGLLELIADEKPGGKIEGMVSTAQDAAAGLLEILDDILDFAKMDADRMELDVFEVPVRLLVRGLLEALAVKVHGVNIKLIDDIEEGVPFVVVGDPKRLRQIIMNLCGNALKFTKAGSVTVHVSMNVQAITPPKMA